MQVSISEKHKIKHLLSGHNLISRLPLSSFKRAFQFFGIQATSYEHMVISVVSRVKQGGAQEIQRLISLGELQFNVGVDQTHFSLIRREDRALFSSLVPITEEELQIFFPPFTHILSSFTLSLWELVYILMEATELALQKGAIPASEMIMHVSRSVLSLLDTQSQDLWMWPDPICTEQTVGDAIVTYLIPLLAYSNIIDVIVSPNGQHMCYRLAESSGGIDDPQAFVRAYLRQYGPSDAKEMAHWAHISEGHATRLWSSVLEELHPVVINGKEKWMMVSDIDLSCDKLVEGLRFIAPGDPLCNPICLKHIVQGKNAQRFFLDNSDRFGMILFDGECVGGWSLGKQKERFAFTLYDIGEPLGRVADDEILKELSSIGKALELVSEGYSIMSL